MPAFCSSCGNPLPPMARFCPNCGSIWTGMPPMGYAAPPQRLFRPFFGRKFAGVCAAFASAYGWDISLVRIITGVAGVFLFPFPEIFYLIAWIAIPEEPVAIPEPFSQVPPGPVPPATSL